MTLSARLGQLFGSRSTAMWNPQRWVVLDVESSGLDAKRDRLIAIAAMALHLHAGKPHIHLGDSFEVVVWQPDTVTDKANILIHGIGVGAQRAGMEPGAALRAFEAWLGDAPLIAFHAAFDETLVQRAMKDVLGRRLENHWLDLEPVAAALNPQLKARSLDQWLAHFDIECKVRHQAAADTLATAELLLRLWPAFRAQGLEADFAALERLAAQGRWLQR